MKYDSLGSTEQFGGGGGGLGGGGAPLSINFLVNLHIIEPG